MKPEEWRAELEWPLRGKRLELVMSMSGCEQEGVRTWGWTAVNPRAGPLPRGGE